MQSRRFSLNSSGLKSVFEKYRFRDGSVWTVGGVTIETKPLRFQIPPVWCGRGVKEKTDSDLMDVIFVLSINL